MENPVNAITRREFLVSSGKGMVGAAVAGRAMSALAQERVKGSNDKVMLALVKDLYNGPYDAKEVVILMELYDLVETAVDRARDAGQVVFLIMLKYS